MPRNQFLEKVHWWLDWIIKWLLEELVTSVALMPKQQYPTPQMRRHLNHIKNIHFQGFITMFISLSLTPTSAMKMLPESHQPPTTSLLQHCSNERNSINLVVLTNQKRSLIQCKPSSQQHRWNYLAQAESYTIYESSINYHSAQFTLIL